MKSGPLVILDGNCQAHHIGAILDQCAGVEACCIGDDYGFLPAFRGRPTRFLNDAEALSQVKRAKQNGRPVYQASQSTQLVKIRTAEYTPLVDKVISFPFLQFYTLSPAVFTAKFGFVAKPKRIFDLDVGTVRVSQEKAESRFDYSDFIAKTSPSRPLFQTVDHLGGELTACLFRDVAQQIIEMHASEVSAIVRELEAGDGMNFMSDHPMESGVLQQLGFNWSPRYDLYREMLISLRQKNWTAILARRSEYVATFAADSQAWHAVALAAAHTGDDASAEKAYDVLLSLSPGHLEFWFDWFDVYLRRQDKVGLQSAIERAAAFFSGQRMFSYLMAFTEMRRGAMGTAEDFAMDYLKRVPERAGGWIPLLKVLCVTDRVAIARDRVTTYLASSTPRQLADLKDNLVLLPELGYSPDDLDQLAKAAH